MQPEKKLNPFTPVSFQDLDDRPAQSKPKQPTPPPMMVPGQRYSSFSSSYLSKPSAIPPQREEKRLGERASLPTRVEGGRATASPALWQSPSFAPRNDKPAASGPEGSRTAAPGFAPPLWRERPQAQPASAPSVGGFSRAGSLNPAAEKSAAEPRPVYLPNDWEGNAATVPNASGYTPNEYPAGRAERLAQAPAEVSENPRAEKPASFGVPSFAPSFAPYGEALRAGAAHDKTAADESASAPLTSEELMRRWEEDRPVVRDSDGDIRGAASVSPAEAFSAASSAVSPAEASGAFSAGTPAVVPAGTPDYPRAEKPASFSVPSFAPSFAPYGEDMRAGAAHDKTAADESASAPLTSEELMRRWEEDRPVVRDTDGDIWGASLTETPAASPEDAPENTQAESSAAFATPYFMPSFAPDGEDERAEAAIDGLADEDEDVELVPLQEDAVFTPPEYASYAHPLRGFGAPVTIEDDEDAAAETAPAQAEKPAVETSRRRSRMQRRHDAAEETESEELISAAPRAYEAMSEKTEPAPERYPEYVPVFEQDTLPEIQEDMSYYWHGGYGLPQVPSRGNGAGSGYGEASGRTAASSPHASHGSYTDAQPYGNGTASASDGSDYSTPYLQPVNPSPSAAVEENRYETFGGTPDFTAVPQEEYTDFYGQPMEPSQPDFGEEGRFDPFGGAPDFAAVPQEEYTDFYGQPMEPSQPDFGEEGRREPFAGAPDFTAVPQEEYAEFYGQPPEPTQPAFHEQGSYGSLDGAPDFAAVSQAQYADFYVQPLEPILPEPGEEAADAFGSAPDFADVSRTESTGFYGQPVSSDDSRTIPGAFTSSTPPVQTGDMYRNYRQMARQAQAPLNTPDGQTRPQPAFDPRTRQAAQPEQQAEKEPRRKLSRPEMLNYIFMIGIGIILIVLLVVVTSEFGKIFDQQDQSQAVWEQYSQTHTDSSGSNPVMVALPDSGQTLPAGYTPTPTLIPDTPTPPPSVGVDGAYPEAVVQETSPSTGSRTKVERYPNNHFAYKNYYALDNAANPALMGMLSIPGVLNEYVVQAQGDDPSSKYLSVDYRGGASPGGAVYIDKPGDLRTPPENIILRGSDAAEGKVFQPLWQYVTDNTFYIRDGHAFARLTTLYEEAYYVLIAVIVADVSSEKDDYFDFAGKSSFATNNLMMAFVNDAKKASIRNMNVEALPNDRLMTLATVSTHRDGKCLIMVYRMVRDGEMHNVPVQAFPTPTPTPVPSETPVPGE